MGFFVPANPPSWGIRGGISDSFQILKAIVLQLRTILELSWSYNPPMWSYVMTGVGATSSELSNATISFCSKSFATLTGNKAKIVPTHANKKRSCSKL